MQFINALRDFLTEGHACVFLALSCLLEIKYNILLVLDFDGIFSTLNFTDIPFSS